MLYHNVSFLGREDNENSTFCASLLGYKSKPLVDDSTQRLVLWAFVAG
jgi:hypothetical protein